MPDSYFFLRPLLAADKHWAALECCIAGPTAISGSQFTQMLNEADYASLTAALPLVFSFDPDWLADGQFIQNSVVDQAILVLPGGALDDGKTVEACQDLRRRGCFLGVRIDHPDRVNRVSSTAFDCVQIEGLFARYELSALDFVHLDRAGLRKVATEVRSSDLFRWLTGKHFDLIDGRFVATLDPADRSAPDLKRLKVLKLLSLVIQDADTREIEEIFRQEACLAHSLLRLVNSVAVGAKTRISSFHQAITLLGRRPLQRWLQLLIYADQLVYGNQTNPLLQLAAARGRQMEFLSASGVSIGNHSDRGDEAFMTGIFSLLDVLLKMPMGEILAELPLPEEVVDALAARKGALGDLLAAVVDGESGDAVSARATFSALGISPLSHLKAQVAALLWATRINSEK